MSYIDQQLKKFKTMIENSIQEGGNKAKDAIIRSQIPINLIHDAVKEQLISKGIDPELIFPPLNSTKPEIKITGGLKQKNQDICVLPKNIEKKPSIINWGLMSHAKITDDYGFDYSSNSLIINVRSQMSSLEKNFDTLYERTYAEAMNLHMRYNNAVLGEVYLIPTQEYDDKKSKNKIVEFKKEIVNLEKYITSFSCINKRNSVNDEIYKYERVALLIVDFTKDTPKLFKSSEELKNNNLISDEFNIEYSTMNFDNFSDDLIKIYTERFNIKNLLKS